ncbi:HECT-like protein [Artemisia annua]|uniref:HECT-type E3 ubiquitin transferase n=1 Tax=Artemisia annua TaxID=35608 RepID=A0A2U1PHC7_ARTAN|nr:HECT-like protein [Artemisia annua]
MFDGRFLKQEESLPECMITNNSELYLQVQMGNYVETWTNDLASEIYRLFKGGAEVCLSLVEMELMDFVKMIPKDDVGIAAFHADMFTSCSAPEYIVMLYMRPEREVKFFAETSVKHLISTITCTLPQPISLQFAPSALKFCKLFRRANLVHDALYKLCRSYLAMIMKQDNNFDGGCNDNMFPYATEQVNNISVDLVCLLLRYAKKGEDYEWIFEHKELIDFFSRRHLVMLMLPDVHDNAFDVHRMVIDRSNLLVDSFESITHAQLDFLRAGLYIEFLNEEETGFGMMREWFFLVCREIFNPKNGLFIARAWKILNKNINDVFMVRRG